MSGPFIDCGGYSVHTIDSFHEGSRDTSGEEVDEGIFMGDFAESDMVFELGDVVSEWEVLCDGCGGEPGDCFILDIYVDK